MSKVNMLEEISNFIFTSKYAKYIPELKRRETWEESVQRSLEMHLKKYKFLTKEDKDKIKWAFSLVQDKRVAGSMRAQQFAGPAIESKNEKIYNCVVKPIDSIRAFAELSFLALNGCGTTFGVSKKYISRLPDLVEASDKTGTVVTYTISDTIEGWSDSLEALLLCYFKNTAYTGRKIVFDYSRIRKKGAQLKTTGGRAPGYKGLKNCHIKIKQLLDRVIEEEGQKRLKSSDICDILCHTLDSVLSGGVRRSAGAAVFDSDDEDMINYKIGDWFKSNPQRARVNISALILRDKITLSKFKEIVNRTREFGDPGFVFADDEDAIFNPCFEIGFIPRNKDGLYGAQFCVSGDTKLITREGITCIQDSVGKEVEIWNGQNWSKSTPFITSTDTPLYRVSFGDGSFLDVTDNHKFLVKRFYQSKYSEVTTDELLSLMKSREALSTPRYTIEYNGGTKISQAFEYGFFIGDGHLDHGVPKANLYNKDKEINLCGEVLDKVYLNSYGTEYKTIKFTSLDKEFCVKLKTTSGLPSEIFSWDKESILNFFGGWVDADGTKANEGCRLYGSEQKIRDAQLLATKVGIISSVNLMSKKGFKTNLGVRKNDVWYLQIPNASLIKSRRLNLISGTESKFKGKFQTIRSVVPLPGLHTTYCLTEDILHQCVFNNVLTKQCNLSTINGLKVKTKADFKECVEAAVIIGTLQSGYTKFPYLSSLAKELTEEEALLGVSITGLMDSPDILLNPDYQEEFAKYAVNVNKSWAKKLNINQASRVTCIKPEGTTSLIFGSASGIHPHHARKYVRRVQNTKIDNVYRYFKKHNPHMCKESIHSANKTDDVIEFPIEISPNSMIKDDLTAIKHLEIIKSTQKHWVNNGTSDSNRKNITHNVSCTVEIKDEEWDEVIEYLFKNKKFFAAVSLLPQLGDKLFKQAPNERIVTPQDEETFKMLLDKYVSVDYTKLIESEDETHLQQEVSCAGGKCER